MSWVNIEGYKYQYQINEEGKIRVLDLFGNYSPVRINTVGQRRSVTTLCREDGVKVSVPVVNIMANAFMGGKPDGYNIIHKNGNKHDNRLANLQFTTKAETARFSVRNQRKPVAKMTKDKVILATYFSTTEAAKKNYISVERMGSLCKGKFEDSCRMDGFFYRYLSEMEGKSV